jgi:hypothetical protein
MSPGDAARDRLAFLSQNEAAIFFVLEQLLGIKSLHHVGHTGLGNFQTGRDVDDTGVTLALNELEDAFEIIFDRGGIADGFAFGWHEVRQNKRARSLFNKKVFGD